MVQRNQGSGRWSRKKRGVLNFSLGSPVGLHGFCGHWCPFRGWSKGGGGKKMGSCQTWEMRVCVVLL